MVRIIDVAEAAGVSVATVSRVLNGISVRPELESAVKQAVAELGYTPNRTARALRSRTTTVIGLIVADIENPFFTSFARALEDAAQMSGYSVVLCNSDEDPEKEQRYLRVAVDEHMAGVVIFPSSPKTDLSELVAHNIAITVADRFLRDDLDTITFDNYELGLDSTRSLISAGANRIACITGPERISTAVERARGWREALRSANLPMHDRYYASVPFTVEGGRNAIREMLVLPEPPDSVLATNNLVGLGVMQELSRNNRSRFRLNVIGEMPFVSSTDQDVRVTPLDTHRMGRTAWRLLSERITGHYTGPGRRILLSPAHPQPWPKHWDLP